MGRANKGASVASFARTQSPGAFDRKSARRGRSYGGIRGLMGIMGCCPARKAWYAGLICTRNVPVTRPGGPPRQANPPAHVPCPTRTSAVRAARRGREGRADHRHLVGPHHHRERVLSVEQAGAGSEAWTHEAGGWSLPHVSAGGQDHLHACRRHGLDPHLVPMRRLHPPRSAQGHTLRASKTRSMDIARARGWRGGVTAWACIAVGTIGFIIIWSLTHASRELTTTISVGAHGRGLRRALLCAPRSALRAVGSRARLVAARPRGVGAGARRRGGRGDAGGVGAYCARCRSRRMRACSLRTSLPCRMGQPQERERCWTALPRRGPGPAPRQGAAFRARRPGSRPSHGGWAETFSTIFSMNPEDWISSNLETGQRTRQ